MATTTAYGYKIMEAGDLVSVWMVDIAANFTRLSDHSHDGSNSRALTPNAITKYSSTITNSWGAVSGGHYKQTITVPAGITEINDFDVMFYDTNTGERLFPGVTRVSATTYDVFVSDSTLELTAKYL